MKKNEIAFSVEGQEIKINPVDEQVKEQSTKPTDAKEFIESKFLDDKILNRYDLPEHWISISQLMEEYHLFKMQSKS